MNMNFARFLVCASVALVLPVTAQAAPDPNFHIYLLLGQSNMQGAAHLPPEPITHPRVEVLQDENCPGYSAGYGEWRELFQPIVRCEITDLRQKTDGSFGPIGLGPGDTFATTMADADPSVTIGLVGAAFGGTDIEYHVKNCSQYGACAAPYGSISGAPGNGNNGAYAWALDLAKIAQERGVIKGFIMHHGENNAGQQSWLSRVQEIVTDLRNDLGLDPAETPFIAGELPYTGGSAASHNPLVRQIPDYVENGHYVTADPMPDGTVLGDRGDGIHWSTESVIEMGKRYAEKMLEVGNYGPVDCGIQGDDPICCNISADPDGDGIGEQNEGERCVVTEETQGWHPPNPDDVAVAINVGASGDAVPWGDIYFDADRDFSGGTTNSTTDSVSGSGGSAVAQSERYGDFSYAIPLANGEYQVELGFVELYHTAAAERAFNVSIEGQAVESGLDTYAEVGHDAVYSGEYSVTVSDGTLDIVIDTVTDNGSLSSILVRTLGAVSSSSSSVASSSAPSSSSSSSTPASSASSSSSAEPEQTADTGGSLSWPMLLLFGLAAPFLRRRKR